MRSSETELRDGYVPSVTATNACERISIGTGDALRSDNSLSTPSIGRPRNAVRRILIAAHA